MYPCSVPPSCHHNGWRQKSIFEEKNRFLIEKGLFRGCTVENRIVWCNDWFEKYVFHNKVSDSIKQRSSPKTYKFWTTRDESSSGIVELRLLMSFLERLDNGLVPRYIRSEHNPADFFSRMTDHDTWTLSPSFQCILMQRAQAMFCKSISLDVFTCPMSTVKSDISLRLQTLRSKDIDRGRTFTRLEQWSRLAEPTVRFVDRRHLQNLRGAPNSCGCRTNVAVPNVVVIPGHPRSVSCRSVEHSRWLICP